MPRRIRSLPGVALILACVLSTACTTMARGPETAPRVTPAENGWFQVDMQPWFTVEMPAPPRVTIPEVVIPFTANVEATQLDATLGRQTFVVSAIRYHDGFSVSSSELVQRVVDGFAKEHEVTTVHRPPDGSGADLTLRIVEGGQALQSRVVLVVVGNDYFSLITTTPENFTQEEHERERRFLHSVRDLPK
jgi:hypothetical protein